VRCSRAPQREVERGCDSRDKVLDLRAADGMIQAFPSGIVAEAKS